MLELEPDCPNGYSTNYLMEHLSARDYQSLMKWMNGQTMTICDGSKYNHEWKRYEFTECHSKPHGTVIYEHDFQDWAKGLPVQDW